MKMARNLGKKLDLYLYKPFKKHGAPLMYGCSIYMFPHSDLVYFARYILYNATYLWEKVNIQMN